MKKTVHIFLIVLILSLTLVNTALASPGKTAGGGCPPGFELHEFMDHAGDPMHQHIGIKVDLNGDGYVCVRHLTETKHLHIDNVIPYGG